MRTEDRARAMRADGATVRAISRSLGISPQWANKCAQGVLPEVKPTARTVVRHHPHNGGCSTTSGLMAISMPRITALHGVAA